MTTLFRCCVGRAREELVKCSSRVREQRKSSWVSHKTKQSSSEMTSEMKESQGTYTFRCCKSFSSWQLVKRLSSIFSLREQELTLADSMSLQFLSVTCLATRRIIASRRLLGSCERLVSFGLNKKNRKLSKCFIKNFCEDYSRSLDCREEFHL